MTLILGALIFWVSAWILKGSWGWECSVVRSKSCDGGPPTALASVRFKGHWADGQPSAPLLG